MSSNRMQRNRNNMLNIKSSNTASNILLFSLSSFKNIESSLIPHQQQGRDVWSYWGRSPVRWCLKPGRWRRCVSGRRWKVKTARLCWWQNRRTARGWRTLAERGALATAACSARQLSQLQREQQASRHLHCVMRSSHQHPAHL